MNKEKKPYITQLTVCIARIRFELTIHSGSPRSALSSSVIMPFMRNDLPFTDVCRFDVFLVDSVRQARRSGASRNSRSDARTRFPTNMRTFMTKTFLWSVIDAADRIGFVLKPDVSLAFGCGATLLYDNGLHAGVAVHSCDCRGTYDKIIGTIVRTILGVVLPHMNGCIFHASAVSIDGRAHVFLGKSGAGKSTVARIIDPDHVFGDERCIMRRVGRQYYCYTTPWWLEKNDARFLSRRGRVSSISFLHKSRQTAVARCSMPKALKKILGEAKAGQLPWLFIDKKLQKRVIAFYADLFAAVPAFDLHVRKGESFACEFRRFAGDRNRMCS